MFNQGDSVLVTGGAGFIGAHLIDLLVAQDLRVRVLEKPGASTSHLPTNDVEVELVDVRDARGVRRAARDCDIVIHLAANPNLWARDPHEFETINHQGTRNVLEAAADAAAHRIIFVSTESILAPPGHVTPIDEQTRTSLDEMIGPYCRSKWLAERAAADAALAGRPVVIVRPSIPVGPGDRRMGPPSRMICDFCNGRIKGYLDGTLNLIDVRDIAAGICAAAQRGEPGKPYLLVNENWTILELFESLAAITGRSAPRLRVPYRAALSFAHAEEFFCNRIIGRTPMATVTGVKLTQRAFHFDGRCSARDLELGPMRGCQDAIAESLDWYRAAGFIRSGTKIAGEMRTPELPST